jgi:IS5 family transposase
VRNWGYDTLEREVRANLVYRAFTRVGDGKVPDAKTLARIGQVIGPEVIRNLHERLVELAIDQRQSLGYIGLVLEPIGNRSLRFDNL